MNTNKFRTRQESGSLTYPHGRDYIIAVDVGYSSTKIFCETGYRSFPSFAREINEEQIMTPDKDDILYRDEKTKKVYLVGRNAQRMADSDTNDTDAELFSRNRYANPMFRILCCTAIGLACMTKKDGRKIVVQTGLPVSYMSDETKLKKVFTSMPCFSLKVGKSAQWATYDFTVEEGDVHVMPQPMGSLYSALTCNDGRPIPNCSNMLSSNVIVLDGGFGTFDFYGYKQGKLLCAESIDNTGMRAVFQGVIDRIHKECHADVRITALQECLTTGKFVHIDEEDMSSTVYDISGFLESASKEVFELAKVKIRGISDALRGYDYIIVAGGTGEAWFESIKEWLSKLHTIKGIIPSNVNDHLPCIYSNARGYYMYRVTANRRGG